MEGQRDLVWVPTLNIRYYDGVTVIITVVGQEARFLTDLYVIHLELHRSDEVVLHCGWLTGDMDGLVNHKDHCVAISWVVVGKSGRDSSEALLNTECRIITSDVDWTVEVSDY